jgi:GntR family transcriptional regulator, uxu operon transcriptional repressor
VEKARTSHDVAQDIGRKIDTGEWPDGFRVPAERELAATYRLARNTIRRALRELDSRLVRIVGRGTFVKGNPAGRTREFVSRLRDASPTDIMEVRLIMEPQAAALAAHRASTADLAEIETILRKSIAAKGTAEFEHWDAALHLAIFRATKNALLIDYCEAINAARSQPHWYHLKQRNMTETLRRQYDQQHSAVVSALLQRDAEAARRLQIQHLNSVRDRLLAIEA